MYKLLQEYRKYILYIEIMDQQDVLKDILRLNNTVLKRIVYAFLLARKKTHWQEEQEIFSRCNTYREKLLHNFQDIDISEIHHKDISIPINNLYNNSSLPIKWCYFLYYIVKLTEYPFVIELGTCLWVSWTYILEAMKTKEKSYFVSIEAVKHLCDISFQQFSTIASTSSFDIRKWLFKDLIPLLLEENRDFNIFFIDGNHKKDPTLRYFISLKEKATSSAIFIFDDIDRSEEMKDAWDILKSNKDVNYSLDLGRQGIVIIDKNDTNRNMYFSLYL